MLLYECTTSPHMSSKMIKSFHFLRDFHFSWLVFSLWRLFYWVISQTNSCSWMGFKFALWSHHWPCLKIQSYVKMEEYTIRVLYHSHGRLIYKVGYRKSQINWSFFFQKQFESYIMISWICLLLKPWVDNNSMV